MKDPRLLVLVAQLRTSLLWVAAVVIVITVVFGNLPGSGRYSGVLQDSCHAPAFGALAFIMLTLVARRDQHSRTAALPEPNIGALLLRCLMTVVAMGLLGGATELLQALLGRDAQLDDAISDVIGAATASGLWFYLQLQGAGTGIAARLGRTGAVLVCAGAFAYWATPLVKCASAYWHRNAQFPVLARFHDSRDLYFVDSAGLGDNPIVSRAAGAAPTALRVGLDNGRWPGVTFFELVPDWRGYHSLTLELSNSSGAPLTLHLRVNDRAHDDTLEDRFNTLLQLPPHAHQTFTIPLERIAAAPRARRMDMSRIATLIVFHDGTAPGAAFMVQRIALE